jgi:hypothetical protein
MSLVYRKDAMFVDDDPVDLEKALPKDWSPALRKISVYWLVEHPTMHRTRTRLAIIKGSPRNGTILDSVNVDTNEWEESNAPLTDIGEAIEMYRKEQDFIFEEFPYVEVEQESDYNRAVGGHGIGPKDWSPIAPDSAWSGPGVYDFRDRPPTRAYKSVEEYEFEGMEERSKQVLESTYDDDYKEPLMKLLADYVGGQE